MYLVQKFILHTCNNVEISEHFNIQLKFQKFVPVTLSSNISVLWANFMCPVLVSGILILEFIMLQKNKAFNFLNSILISKMKSKIGKDKENCHI